MNKNKELSLRGAVGEVVISCDKALSSRGRAESSDVAISCDKVLMNKKNPEKTKTVIPDLIGYLSRFLFNSKIPGIFRLTAKNRDDSFFVASPRTRFSEIATSAFRLLAMTPSTLALAAVLSIATIIESRAEVISCVNGKYADGTACEKCGDNCDWELVPVVDENNQPVYVLEKNKIQAYTLNITGSGEMNDFTPRWSSNPAPWAGSSELTRITSVNISGVTSVGEWAFSGASALSSVNMPDVTSVGQTAFYALPLTNVNVPNVKSIGYCAFCSTLLTDIDLPNITNIERWAFLDSQSLSYVELPSKDDEGCLVNQKGERLSNGTNNCVKDVTIGAFAFTNKVSSCSTKNYDACNVCKASDSTGPLFQPYASGGGGVCQSSCNNGYAKSNGLCKKKPEVIIPKNCKIYNGTCTKCTSTYLAKEGHCISASEGCGSSFRLNDGVCDRIRYTPAEAAQYLKDTDNTFIMTFKVN